MSIREASIREAHQALETLGGKLELCVCGDTPCEKLALLNALDEARMERDAALCTGLEPRIWMEYKQARDAALVERDAAMDIAIGAQEAEARAVERELAIKAELDQVVAFVVTSEPGLIEAYAFTKNIEAPDKVAISVEPIVADEVMLDARIRA